MYRFDRTAYDARMRWWLDARFGMFVHWGIYAIPARGEWVRSVEELPDEAYAPYAAEFGAPDFDPQAWARLAREAGMRYLVLTAKHHDGFCLFDSALTDFKVTNAPLGRDVVGEVLDAARAEGLRVGLYFSLIDWHHPDFPQYGDRNAPLRRDAAAGSNEGRDWDRYLAFMHGQVRELCTNYGRLDLLWFDFSYDDMRGERWGATRLMEMVRELQPDVIVNNRLEVSGEGMGSLAACAPNPYHGDFVTPEQIVPPRGLLDAHGDPLAWEACVTMNDHWGYCAADRRWKPAGLVVRKLVECVSKGGNLILNVGPDARGRVPEACARELREAIAEHAHDAWATARRKEGWTYGPVRDDRRKQHPDLVPYASLPEGEKEYDRLMATNTIKLLKKLGFEVVKRRKQPGRDRAADAGTLR